MLCFFDFPASAARISYAPGIVPDVFDCVLGGGLNALAMDRPDILAQASKSTCSMYL